MFYLNFFFIEMRMRISLYEQEYKYRNNCGGFVMCQCYFKITCSIYLYISLFSPKHINK